MGFFFTGKKGRGERIVFQAKALEGGKDVLIKICDAIGKGAFCGFMEEDNFEKGACKYCDYQQICLTCGAAKDVFDRKYKNKENKSLKPLAELKQYVQE